MSRDLLNLLVPIVIYYATVTILAYPLGSWLFYVSRKGDSSTTKSMNWKTYSLSLLVFSVVNLLFLAGMLRYQNYLPGNPQGFDGLSWPLAFNTAASFVTNTNWQAYSGEVSLSILSQSVGLCVQNFLSASVGLCVLFAICRGFSSNERSFIGDFWLDLKNTTFYFLLPLSIVFALILVSQGVPQTYDSSKSYVSYESNEVKTLPLGLVASQVAIKQLGTNGGGYFNVNSSHPLENPTPVSNFFQAIAILLIPAACCFYYGLSIKDRRQGFALYAVMLTAALAATIYMAKTELFSSTSYYPDSIALDSGKELLGNMEGKEVRFGPLYSVIWSVATTAASNGSVNSMLDSYVPLAGIVPMFLMQVGEVIYGGVGSGLYGMIAFVIIAVFIAGLMIGRTPEYLGKKIEIFEMKMVSIIILIPCVMVLISIVLVLYLDMGSASVSNPGAHGFSQILYAYSSMGNNNGSAFGGFSSGLDLHLWLGGVVMIISRFGVIIPILALAGSISNKKIIPSSVGTLQTHTLTFSIFLISIIFIVGALTFVPALVLGPIADSLL